MSETCNECGRSVKWGSGRLVNRAADFNGPSDRAGPVLEAEEAEGDSSGVVRQVRDAGRMNQRPLTEEEIGRKSSG
jgi:hypothetical protein